MSKKGLSIIWLLPLLLSNYANAATDTQENDLTLLPGNHPVIDVLRASSISINRDYTGEPGCYVACYSRNSANALNSVGKDAYGRELYVYGQIRVPGQYNGPLCEPTGYENIDISKEHYFNELCESHLSVCQGNACWAGKETRSSGTAPHQ